MKIAEIWNEAFGDSIPQIFDYLEYLLQFFYVCEENSSVNAIASVLPITFSGKKGGYVYAVATKKAERGRGLSTELINYLKSLNEYEFLVLVPQNKGLFEFYEKRGFMPLSSVKTKELTVGNLTGNKVSCEEISSKEYFLLRKKYCGQKLIEWGIETLDFAKKMYGGKFLKVMCDEQIFACFCFNDNEKLVIKELLCENGDELGVKIADFYGCTSVTVTYPDSLAEPSAMIFPEEIDGGYFAIALD